jgi:hypothetical protein
VKAMQWWSPCSRRIDIVVMCREVADRQQGFTWKGGKRERSELDKREGSGTQMQL